MIRERRAMVDKAVRHDLLSCLLEANDLDSDQETLNENEIISMLFILHRFNNINLVTNVPGNIYMFLVAGHEVRNLHSHSHFWFGNKMTIWLDGDTYFRLRICVVGVVPWWTGEGLWGDQVSYQRARSGMFFIFNVLCAEFHMDYLDLWGNASFYLFLSVWMLVQVFDLSPLTEVFQCHLRNITIVSACSLSPDISTDPSSR